jgi:iron complex outermembrane receptor protein
MVLSGERFSLTVDAYAINLDDRFNAVSPSPVSTTEVTQEMIDAAEGDEKEELEEGLTAYTNYLALAANNVAGANTLGAVQWFTNAFDTSSKGVDIVATMPFEFDNSSGKLTASMNYNKAEYRSDVAFFTAEDKYDFLNIEPNTRWILTYNHYMGNLALMGRLSYYGESDNSNGSVIQNLDAVTFLDLEASYQVTEQLRVMLGGRNLTDEYPEVDEIGDYCCGRIYSSGTTVDWQGAYYYGRLTFDF